MPYRWQPLRVELPLDTTGPELLAAYERLDREGKKVIGVETYPPHLAIVTAPLDPRDMSDMRWVDEVDKYQVDE